MNCVFIGDSIAVGVAARQPKCVNQAAVFQTTAQTLSKIKMVPKNTEHVIISVGSNDHVNSEQDIQSLRASITAPCVTWLIPFANPGVRQYIIQVARRYQDRILDIKPFVSADRIHPTAKGYQQLAAQLDLVNQPIRK